MKKTLLSLGLVLSAAASFAQVDTLISHVTSPNFYTGGLDAVAPADSGFLAGNNVYGDIAKMQLFDNTYGVTSGGVINGVALWAPIKVDNGGTFTVAIWADNAGAPNPVPLTMVTATLASLDTTIANTGVISGAAPYNHVAMFTSPLTIPAGNKFWAGVVLPTGSNLMAIVISGPFADADTHSGEFWNDATFHTFGDPNNWGADYSMAIYPIVDLVASLEENVITSTVYPNPANNELNIQVGNEEIETVSVVTLDGKTVINATTGAINVSELKAGMYIYNVTTKAGKLATGNFVKN